MYHVNWQIKISRTIFEKGHSRNISIKLFQNLTSTFREEDFLGVCSCPYSQSSPHSLVPCLKTDQKQLLRKVTRGTFLWNYFKIWGSGFGQDFLRISSCLYSAQSPHSHKPCLWMDQNFANIFWKGSPKEHSCETISKSDWPFQRRRF